MLHPCLVAASFLLLAAPTSRAVIVAGGDGTQNTVAPTNDFGFANVGHVFDTLDGIYVSGVYLGDGWMISAYHGVRNGNGGFQFGDVLLAGASYPVDAQTAVRLTTNGAPSDLVVFRLAGAFPNLPSVSLSSTTPPIAAPLALAGNGRNRALTETNWNVSPSNVWTETPVAGSRQGYLYAPGAIMRWGNNIRSLDPLGEINAGYGPVSVFRTTFSNDLSEVPSEAQAAPGDSGGGVFHFDPLDARWELAGIMVLTSSSPGQPLDSAVFGNQTLAADIATYRSQIVGAVPEPSTATLVIFGTVGLAARRRRR